MRVFPILLDSRPRILEGTSTRSLLSLSLGAGTLLEHLTGSLESLGASPTVLPTFRADADYEREVREACPAVEDVVSRDGVHDWLRHLEPSDLLVIVDPRCYPVSGLAPATLLGDSAAGSQRVRHLMALEPSYATAEECVEFASSGDVRRIQRYYGDVTWPYTAGLFCTVLPVSCTLIASELPLWDLPELRRCLSGWGVASQDVTLNDGSLDLTDEWGVLALSERVVRALAARGAASILSSGGNIDPTARLIGPVVAHSGARVEPNATVIGPSLLAAGSRVGRGAVVAQCYVGRDVTVPDDIFVRQRSLLMGFAATPATETASCGAPAETETESCGAPASTGRDFRGTELGEFPRLAALWERRRLTPYPTVKRLLDATAALLGLVVLSPLIVLLAILVKLDSRGPILYGDEREGRDGRLFRCWKFRTMVKDAHARQRKLLALNKVDGPQFKMDRDPRVTRVGRWLRPTNLDELPQLINVLLGQMSFVGPRPSPFRENQMCIPWRRARLSVRPGITGLWQVCRHERSSGDFHQWIYYDLLYVRHMSFWLDVKILAATLATLGGRTYVPMSWLLSEKEVRGGKPLGVAA